MIKNAVFSYWNPLGAESTSGFNTIKDLCYSTLLSVECARNFFPSIKLYTNDYGRDLLVEKAGIEFDEVSTELSKFDKKLDHFLWGYTKVYVYAQQKEPFLHIDNDFFIWKFKYELYESSLLFQSPEIMDNFLYKYYDPLVTLYNSMPSKVDFVTKYPTKRGLNCGIMGGHNLEIIKEWHEASEKFINNKQNIIFLKSKYPEQVEHFNLLHEQYFISCLTKKYDIEPTFIVRDLVEETKHADSPITHMWGTTKRQGIIENVKEEVRRRFPEKAEIIERNL